MLYLGSDHAGYLVKQKIIKYLDKKGLVYEDLGAYTDKVKSDYPDYAKKVAKKVIKNKAQGILICGSAVGICIAANKFKGIRAALVYDAFTSRNAKEDDNANIICLRGRKTSATKQVKLLDIFLNAKFKAFKRYKRRIKKIE